MTRGFCSKCGAGADEGDRFCPECGGAIEAPAPARGGSGTPERDARRWLGRRGLFLAIPVIAVLAGAAVAASLVFGDVPEDHAVELVPPDAAFYATIHLDPSLGQKRAAKGVLDRARQLGVDDASTDSLEDAIENLLTDSTPLSYERDVKPQLGSQIAIYARAEEDPALLVSTTDAQASLETMRRVLEEEFDGDHYRIAQASHRGQPYERAVYEDGSGSPSGLSAFTILDGFVVAGSEQDVKGSIDAHAGESLKASERFSSVRDELSDDVLAAAYYDAEPLADAVRSDEYSSDEEVTALDAMASGGPVAATITARDDRLALDLAAPDPAGDAQPLREASSLLETLPADAIAAVSLGDAGALLRGVLADGSNEAADGLREATDELAELDPERDLTSWLGQLGLYVAGADTDTVEGALVAETRSSSDSDRALSQIESHNASEPDYDDYGYEYGTSVYASGDGLGFDVAEDGEVLQVRGDEDRVIAGMGAGFSSERALDADGGFGESEAYRRAASSLGGAYEPFLVIDAPPVQSLLEQAADAEYDSTYVGEVRPWLSSIATLAGGVRHDGDGVRVKIVAEFRNDDGR